MWAQRKATGNASTLIEHDADINAHGTARLWDRRILSNSSQGPEQGWLFTLLYAPSGMCGLVELLAKAGAD